MIRRPLVAAFASLFVVVAACGGRNLEAGPEPTVIYVDGDGGEGGAAGVGGAGGDAAGGFGGFGEGGTAEGGAGGGGIMPIECISCIATECPSAIDCITNPACVQGIVCAVGNCLNGGQPDIMCLLGCFDGDLDAALAAVDALTCIGGNCGDYCGDLLPFP
ncbi:MAG: hypothetical protein KC731_12285 [Myxococcales bacterium]|nr:hypothetical protein [Myxococcales bacterium]